MKSNIRQQSIPKTFWMNERLYDIAEELGYISKQDVMNYINLMHLRSFGCQNVKDRRNLLLFYDI